jgi:hypothetical protein
MTHRSNLTYSLLRYARTISQWIGSGRRNLLALSLSLAALLTAVSVQAGRAANLGVAHGNIVLNGKTLTHGGQDSDPAMSLDGSRIVFTRKAGPSPAMKLCEESGGDRLLELWAIAADGSNPRKLLSTHGDDKPQLSICDFHAKQFSSDGQLLYFQTPAWATSGALHVFDLRTNEERFLVPSNEFVVLNQCKDKEYRDDLVVNQHRYFVFGGSYDWAFLFTPQGKELGPLGDDGFAAASAWCKG